MCVEKAWRKILCFNSEASCQNSRLGFFSKYGFGKLVLFTQTLNSKFMCKIYKNGLLPPVKKWFDDNNYNWKLLEDNDPKHISKTSKTFKVNNGV